MGHLRTPFWDPLLGAPRALDPWGQMALKGLHETSWSTWGPMGYPNGPLKGGPLGAPGAPCGAPLGTP